MVDGGGRRKLPPALHFTAVPNISFLPSRPSVIAHRGDSANVPEDTVESLRAGLALGADGIEFDVRLSQDGHVMVIHDPRVDRTTNGTGEVRALSRDELQTLDAGYRFTRNDGLTFPWRDRRVRIPTLEYVLECFPHERLILELKTAEASAETLRLLQRHGARKRCLVGSFHEEALAPFRAAGFATGATKDDVIRLYRQLWRRIRPRVLPYDALMITPRYRSVIPVPVGRFVRMAAACGVATHVWTIDDPAQARRLWAMGVHGIMSNDPAAILRAAGREPIGDPVPLDWEDGNTFRAGS